MAYQWERFDMSGVLQAVFQNLRSFGGGFAAFAAYNVSSSTHQNRNTGSIIYTADGAIFSSRGYAVGCVPTYNNVSVYDSSFVQQNTQAAWINGGAVKLDGQAMAYASSTNRLYVRGGDYSIQIYTFTSASTSPTASTVVRQNMTRSGYNISAGANMKLDASNNIYLQNGAQFNAGCCIAYLVPMVTKATLTGVTWSRIATYQSNSISTRVGNVAVASSGNVYGLGSYSPGYIYLVKFNSSGTKQWDYYYASARNESDSYAGMVIDSSENLYVACTSTSPTVFAFMKFNSSGTMQFRVEITGTDFAYVQGFQIASDGFIYLLANMRRSAGSRSEQALFKFDSSGALQYQRVFTSTTASFSISPTDNDQCLSVGTDGFLYIGVGKALYPPSSETCMFFKYGASGSTLGSYTLNTKNVTIAAGTYTVSTGSTSSGTAANYTYVSPTLGGAVTTDVLYLNDPGYTSTKVAI
jgi:hypothetical protein